MELSTSTLWLENCVAESEWEIAWKAQETNTEVHKMVRKRRTQAEPGRECMQQQEQTSPNLECTIKAISCDDKIIKWKYECY